MLPETALNPLESFNVFLGTLITFSESQVPLVVRKNLKKI